MDTIDNSEYAENINTSAADARALAKAMSSFCLSIDKANKAAVTLSKNKKPELVNGQCLMTQEKRNSLRAKRK